MKSTLSRRATCRRQNVAIHIAAKIPRPQRSYFATGIAPTVDKWATGVIAALGSQLLSLKIRVCPLAS